MSDSTVSTHNQNSQLFALMTQYQGSILCRLLMFPLVTIALFVDHTTKGSYTFPPHYFKDNKLHFRQCSKNLLGELASRGFIRQKILYLFVG